jgi:hypothetical protein
MKKLFSLYSLLFFAMYMNAQCVIQNGGFETWVTDQNNELQPARWFSIGGFRSTNARSGQFAFGLKNINIENLFNLRGTASGSMPLSSPNCNGRPKYFVGHLKTTPGYSDTIQISVFLYRGGNVIPVGVGTGINFLPRVNYTAFHIPIDYINQSTADSLILSINHLGEFTVSDNSFALFDDFQFSETPVGELLSDEPNSVRRLLSANSGWSMQINPNPASNTVKIDVLNEFMQPYSLQILDLSGKLVHKEVQQQLSGKRFEHQFSVASLQPGLYLLQLQTAGGIITRKLIVSR